jgi:N utilization substance protein A
MSNAMWCSALSKPRWPRRPKSSTTGEVDIRVAVDRDSGNYETFRRWLVVPDDAGLQNPEAEEMLMRRAANEISDVEAGDYIEEPVGFLPIGRIGAHGGQAGHPAKDP